MSQQTNIDEQIYVREQLNKYLGSSRLSMRQIAKKWGVSSSMLSQVSNGKKKAGLDLALTIMREGNVDIEKQQKICEQYQSKDSKQFHNLKKDIEKQDRIYQLSSQFSTILESQPFGLDIFLDISMQGENGLSYLTILKHYGEQGRQTANLLSLSELIEKNGERYYIKNQGINYRPTKDTLFGIINNINNKINSYIAMKCFVGRFNLEVNEVSPEGLDELKDLHDKHVKEIRRLYKKHAQPVKDGGIRVSFSTVLGKLRKGIPLMSALLFIFLLNIDPTYAQGLSGGYGDDESRLPDLKLESITRGPKKGEIIYIQNKREILRALTKNHTGVSPVKARVFTNGTAFKKAEANFDWVRVPSDLGGKHRVFETKKAVLEDMKNRVQSAKRALFDKNMKKSYFDSCKRVMNKESNNSFSKKMETVNQLVKDGYIMTTSMKINSVITKDFKEKYYGTFQLMVPCNVK